MRKHQPTALSYELCLKQLNLLLAESRPMRRSIASNMSSRYVSNDGTERTKRSLIRSGPADATLNAIYRPVRRRDGFVSLRHAAYERASA